METDTAPRRRPNSTHGTSLNAGFGAGVSTLSKHKEAAAALVQFQASPRSQETVIGNFGTGADPIRQSTFASAQFRRTFGQAADDVQAGLSGRPLVWPNSVGAVDRLQTLVDELALGIQGKQSAREALQKAQDAWERGVGKTPAGLQLAVDRGAAAVRRLPLRLPARACR